MSEHTKAYVASFLRCPRPLLFNLVAILFLFSSQASLKAQQPINPQGSSVLAGSLRALSAGNPIPQDIVLTGSVTITAGAQATEGTIRLVSNADGMTKVEINVPSGTRVETRRISAGTQAGESRMGSAAVNTTSLHNLLVDPAWFFPEHLVSRTIGSSRSLNTLPAASMDGTMAIGIESYLVSASPSHSATLRQISDLKVFFDETTHLPVEVLYNNHANDSLLKIIPTRIVYANYQVVQGHMVPHHIQRYEKGVLHDDITVTGVVLNPGIASSQYSLN